MGDREYRDGFFRDLRPPPKGVGPPSERRPRPGVRLPLSEVAERFRHGPSTPIEVDPPPGGLPTPRAPRPLAAQPPERARRGLGCGATRAAVEVTEVTFHIWFQPLEPAALLGGTLSV